MRIYEVISCISTVFIIVGISIIYYSFYVAKGKTFPWLHSDRNRHVMIVGIVVASIGQALVNIFWLIDHLQ